MFSRTFQPSAGDELSAMKVVDDQSSVRLPSSPSELFLSFLRLGLTAFGGPSMVAYFRKRRWSLRTGR
jgi:hypothetical protein